MSGCDLLFAWAAGTADLHKEAKHGDHGEAAVLDLLNLEVGKRVGVVCHAEGVEVLPTRVQPVEALAGGAPIYAVSLDDAHKDDLKSKDRGDALRVYEVWGAEIVEAFRGEDLGAGLEPDGLAESSALVLGQDLGGDTAEGPEHGPPTVNHLELPVAPECLRVSRETSSVLHKILISALTINRPALGTTSSMYAHTCA